MKYIVVCGFVMFARGLRINDGHRADGVFNPGKFACAFNSSHASDLSEYDRLFKKWAGQTIMFLGDSLQFQMFNLIRCGAGALGWKHDVEEMTVYYNARESGIKDGFDRRPVAAEHFPFEQITSDIMFDGEGAKENDIPQGVLTKSVIRPLRKSNSDAVVFYMYFFYKVKLDVKMEYRESAPLPPAMTFKNGYRKSKPATLIDVLSSYSVDHMFTNLGHHAIQYASHLNSDIDQLFRLFDAGILEAEKSNGHKKPTLTIIDHPPQHWNNQKGDFLIKGTNNKQPCSNDVPDIHNQLVMENNRLKQQKAKAYGHGFASIDFSESMIPYGNRHFPEYVDCTHYQLSPDVWAGAIKSLVNA